MKPRTRGEAAADWPYAWRWPKPVRSQLLHPEAVVIGS